MDYFLISLSPVVAKTVIMLKVVVRSPLPASWKSRLHADLNFPPVHIALGCLGRATVEPLEETWPVSKEKHICAGCSTARFPEVIQRETIGVSRPFAREPGPAGSTLQGRILVLQVLGSLFQNLCTVPKGSLLYSRLQSRTGLSGLWLPAQKPPGQRERSRSPFIPQMLLDTHKGPELALWKGVKWWQCQDACGSVLLKLVFGELPRKPLAFYPCNQHLFSIHDGFLNY